jgi:hypothetical protein
MPKEAVPLSTMGDGGKPLPIAGKSYTVFPLKLKVVAEFTADNVNIGGQLFSMIDEERKKTVDKWLQKQVFDIHGQPMTLEKAMADDWDLADLKTAVKVLADISG